MPPLIPILLILLIPILLVIGVLFYLGLIGLKAGRTKKILGIISISISFILTILIGLAGYGLVTHEDRQREQFIGTYKSIINSRNSEDIKLTITSTGFSITPNTYTECTGGNWTSGLMDNGYGIDLHCAHGKSLPVLYMKDDELVPLNGNLRFVKSKEVEED